MYFWFKTKEKNAGTNKPNTLDQPHSHYSYTAMPQRKNSIQLARTPSKKDVNMFTVFLFLGLRPNTLITVCVCTIISLQFL